MLEMTVFSDDLSCDNAQKKGANILHLVDHRDLDANEDHFPQPTPAMSTFLNGWRQEVDDISGSTTYVYEKTGRCTYIDPRTQYPQKHVRKIVPRRFSSNATALQIADACNLSGKVAVITGANMGIGFETARTLALNGCHVYLACRSPANAQLAIDRIRFENARAARRCTFVHLDLTSLECVRRCASEIKSSVRHVDMLILNAGLYGLPHKLTEDGVETSFQVCHLGHFYLTGLLDDCLDYRSRVVIVSSLAHIFSLLPTDDLRESDLSVSAAKFNSISAYSDAKLCNILFGRGLAKRLYGRGVCVHSLHPGNFVTSGITRNSWWAQSWFKIVQPFTKTLQQAAGTVVYCAAAPELNGITGHYHQDCYLAKPNKRAQNERMADRLWDISEEMIHRILSAKDSNNKE